MKHSISKQVGFGGEVGRDGGDMEHRENNGAHKGQNKREGR